MTEQVKDKVEDLEKKNLEEGEMPAALKAYIDKKGKKGEKEKEDDAEDDDGEDKKEVKEKKHAKMKEDIDAIFSGEELSEEFKTNAKAIFEAAVTSRVSEIETDLQEQFDTKLNEQVSEIVSGIVDKVDEYLEYVVAEWTEEHKVGIEKNLKAEVAEDFMVGLKNLFVENYIDIPEDKVDLVDEMAKKLQNAETDLDKKITENADLVAELNDYKKEQAVHTVTEGLSEIQIAKLKSLAENIEFISEQDYKNKLTLTKKKYFESKETEKTAVSESKKDLDSADSELEESFTPIMEHYVKNISKIVKR
jgi:hypothetical protein